MANHRALIVVDVQNDFVDGSLATQRGAAVAAAITQYLAQAADRYDAIVGTLDWHIQPAGHFAPDGEAPNFVSTWPVHCVAETRGAMPHENLDTAPIQAWFKKGQYTAAYSGFEGTLDGTDVELATWLRDRGITEVDVVGIATDHCVRATALDAHREGFAVTVLAEMCSPVSEDAARDTFTLFAAEGIAVK